MGLIDYFLDLLKNKDYNSAIIYTGEIFTMTFPTLIYLVLFEIDFVLNVDFPVLLILVLAYNIMLIITSALILFEHQFPLVIADAKLTFNRINNLTKSANELEEEINSILSNKDENAENQDVTSISNQVSSITKEVNQEIEYAKKIIDKYFSWVLRMTILFGFVLTIYIMFYWSIGFDLKNFVRTTDYNQFVLMVLLCSWVVSIVKIYIFNKNNSSYKIKYRWRFIPMALVIALLVYLSR